MVEKEMGFYQRIIDLMSITQNKKVPSFIYDTHRFEFYPNYPRSITFEHFWGVKQNILVESVTIYVKGESIKEIEFITKNNYFTPAWLNEFKLCNIGLKMNLEDLQKSFDLFLVNQL